MMSYHIMGAHQDLAIRCIYLLSVIIYLYDRFHSSGDEEDEYLDEDKGGEDDDEVQILPSRGKKGSSNTSSRPTPRSAEKKNPVSGHTLNVVATTSSSGGKGNGKGGGRGRGRYASPQRDDIEDEEVWDLPVKKEGRQVHTYQEDITNFTHLNFASSQV